MSNAYHFPLPAAFPWLEDVCDVEGNLSSLKSCRFACTENVLSQECALSV